MNQYNRIPPLRPHKGVVAELRFTSSGEQLYNYFDTPEQLEEYLKEQKIQQKKIKNYESWLSSIEWQITQNKENYPSRNIWDNLIHFIMRFADKKGYFPLYNHFEDRIYKLTKKIISR